MKNIIHISDIHVGFKDMDLRLKEIVDGLKLNVKEKVEDYIIVITGDLVDDANHQEYYKDVKSSLDELKNFGFKHILVIPGNHDYGTGSKGDKKFIKLFQGHFFNDDQNYPRKDIIDDVAFIGLDSIAEELHWYDALWSEGELGDEQLDRLTQLVEKEDVRSCQKRVIYLHHHPFDSRPLHQLKDSKKLEQTLKEIMDKGISIDALLYGHNHEGKSHNGHWGIPRCYDGGSATLKPRPKIVKNIPLFQVNSSMRVIDIGNDDINSDYKLSFIKP